MAAGDRKVLAFDARTGEALRHSASMPHRGCYR
jgi:hypothetical protein